LKFFNQRRKDRAKRYHDDPKHQHSHTGGCKNPLKAELIGHDSGVGQYRGFFKPGQFFIFCLKEKLK
jgi:hypothetical protein